MPSAGAASNPPSKALHITLWVVQVLLALAFIPIGAMKLLTPIAEMAKQGPWMADWPYLVRFIGLSEFLGGIGVVLPALTRIRPSLSALAAFGLTIVMVLAFGFHVIQGDLEHSPPSIVLGVLAAFVAWGRWKKAPITPRKSV